MGDRKGWALAGAAVLNPTLLLANAGAVLDANAAYESAKSEEEIAAANKLLAERSAADALQRGSEAAGDIRSEGSRVLGAQRAATAANGVDLASAGNLFSTTSLNVEADVQTAKVNAAREAWGHQLEAKQFDFQRRLAKRQSVLGPLTSVTKGVTGQAQQAAMLAGGA